MRCAKRLARALVNLGLVFASALLTIELATAADRALAPLLNDRSWIGIRGLLFVPGEELEYETHDFHCTEKINGLGFRGDEAALDKTRGYRIVAIGDSFTYGWGVNNEDTWCECLERGLNEAGLDAEVLNLGKPAAGPRDYAAIAETALPFLKPDLVLVGVLAGDDLQQCASMDLKAEFRSRFRNTLQLLRTSTKGLVPPTPTKKTAAETRAQYVRIAAELEAGMSPEQRAEFDRLDDAVKQAFHEGTVNPWMISHATGAPDYFMNTAPPGDVGASVRHMGYALARIRDAAARAGARTLVLSIPEGFYVNEEAYRNIQRVGFRVVPGMLASDVADNAVREACEAHGISFFTATPAFRQQSGRTGLYYALDRHFTPAGNALFADAIMPSVLREVGFLALRRHR